MNSKALFVIFVMAMATLACNLGAVAPSPTPRSTIATSTPAGTLATSLPSATAVSVSVSTQLPTLASGSRNEVATVVVTRIVAATPGVGVCAVSLPSRLVVGGTGRVTPGPSNVIRSQPNRDKNVSSVIGEIPAGGTFTVLAGPQCSNGFAWWQVNYNGKIGWTAEGEGTTYWLEPIGAVANNCPVVAVRLAIGGQGRVTPGSPNILRSGAGKAGTTVIGQIPAGGTFTVLAGPTCADQIRWWQVNYNGTVGWTGEAEGSTYWTEPVTAGNTANCDNISPLRIPVGRIGRVWNNGNPSTLQDQPGQQGVKSLAELAPGASFNVIGGPQCINGIRYLQVNYNGTIGWLGEVQGTTNPYWLEPANEHSGTCPAGAAARMQVGSSGRVTPGSPNAVRTGPGKTGTNVIGQIPASATFLVLRGPICMDNLRWWFVEYMGTAGWTAEGENGTFWIEPVPDNPVCPLFPRLVVGGYGRVTPGQPNRVRSSASMTTGAILGQIPAGDVFDVLDGPRCVSGSRWWYVRYGSLTGWTADAQGSTFWLEPYLPG